MRNMILFLVVSKKMRGSFFLPLIQRGMDLRQETNKWCGEYSYEGKGDLSRTQMCESNPIGKAVMWMNGRVGLYKIGIHFAHVCEKDGGASMCLFRDFLFYFSKVSVGNRT
jgi:hypothetical protein